MSAYSFKRRFVEPIRSGLGITLKSFADIPAPDRPYPKRQTIRSIGKRRHARPGEAVQLYFGMRTKQCFLIGEARCTDVAGVIIWVNPDTIAIERHKGILLGRAAMDDFARDDGFEDARDMAAFWRIEHPGVEKFEGLLIRWEPKNG